LAHAASISSGGAGDTDLSPTTLEARATPPQRTGDAEMVHHAELVVGEGVPRIVDRDRAGRTSLMNEIKIVERYF